MSDNWVVQNLENALNTWNEKLAEIWLLITQTPDQFRGGTIWQAILDIHGALQAIGLALLVLFFVMGVVKTCSSFAEVKRPEHTFRLFVRFAIAKGVVTYGLELMLAIFDIVHGITATIMDTVGTTASNTAVLPSEIITAIEDCGFFESVPLWAVTIIGSLFITVLSFIMILTVYGRFFKLFLYTAIAPVPLSAFAGEPTQSICFPWKTLIDHFLPSSFFLTGAYAAVFLSYSFSPPLDSANFFQFPIDFLFADFFRF